MPKELTPYELAEQKIAEALQSGATELDLRSMQLTELPESIGQLTQLTKLNLSRNQLITLPPSLALAQLTQLTELHLSSNQLTALPDSLGQLTQLTNLNLSSNQLIALPDSLGQLTQLTSLNLSNNQLTTLPDSPLAQLTQLTELNLSKNQLTALPESLALAQLTQLTSLDLSNNQLTALPDSLGQLTQLTELRLSNNQFTTLPDWISQFSELQKLEIGYLQLKQVPEWVKDIKQLSSLSLAGNSLEFLPDWIEYLTNLEHLYLYRNQLTEIPFCISHLKKLKDVTLNSNQFEVVPDWIGNLVNLEYLGLDENNLTEIPSTLSYLTRLETLELSSNQLTDIPSSLAQLEHLKELYLDNNPLNPALQSAYDACSEGKYEPLWAYLRSLEQNAEPLYEAKLVLVGEGNVGKTTLKKALQGKTGAEAPKKDERTTHGVEIDIDGLRLPHPEKDGVEIQLNAWDFGGQDVYRVTHQFFFSRRSLYLLVWEPRRGVQQGQVEDWLNMIRLRVGDDARVIIVSTHCKTGERIARIDQPVFKQQYGDMIVGFHEVDSLVPDPATGEMVGIAELKKVIAEHASKLEQMGMGFNRDWKAARDELLARPEPRISFDAFSGVCAARGLRGIDTETLAHLMHDLGYIVHYADDEKLRDDVILKPEWLTKAIGFVLEDRATAEREGILPDGELYNVWHDHAFPNEPRYDPALYPFFLRLMEKYDVCYRLTDGKASLVAQHVPQVRPELPWLPEQETPKNLRRIAMVCSMEEDPPGLVPWMIVRTHDYAYPVNKHSLHWQKGMFLSHPPHGEAMLEKRGREFHIYTQAEWPEHFMNVIHSTLEKLITDNWPGLKDRYRFMVPCPEMVDGQPCKGRFNIQTLRQFLAEGDTAIRCQECTRKQSIAELLLGFEERTVDIQLREINERFAGMDSRIADYFMATMRAIADEAKNGPRLFTLRAPDVGLSPRQLFSQPLEVKLWCEAEGCQHPVYEKGMGVYKIDRPREWVAKIAPYASFALKVLSTVAPIAGPAANAFFGPKTTDAWGIDRQLNLANAILGKMPAEWKIEEHSALHAGVLSEPERSGILALHRLISEQDPNQERIGLHRVPTYTGDYRWLCKHHYDAYQPAIPDFIDIKGTHQVEKVIQYDVILIYIETDLEVSNNLSHLLEKRQLRVFQKSVNELASLESKEARVFIQSGKSFAFVISNEMLIHLSKMKNRPVITLITETNIPIVAIHRLVESTENGTKKVLKNTRNIDLSSGYRSEQFDEWEYWITGERPPKTKGMTWIDWLFSSGFEEDLSKLNPKEGELSLTPTRIRLRNIRSFVDSGVINLNRSKEPKRHTLLLGDNSSGKSTILQCIALASLGSEKANAFGTRGISPTSYLRQDAKMGFIEVEFQINNNSVDLPFIEDTFVVGLKIEKGENRFESMRTDLTLSKWNANDKLNILRARNDDQFGFMCGYGPWRTLASDPKSLWSESPIPVVDRVSSLFDSNYILGHPDVVAKMLAGDFSNFNNAPKENKDKNFLQKIADLVCKLLPNTNRSEIYQVFTLEMNNAPISIQAMSDGYKSIMAIVGHLLYHSLRRKQWQGDPSDISGTLIIDEIDLHLHPAWQRFVFSSIQEAFPNLHIIASSHSPLVASSVDSESIVVLDKGDDQIYIITDPISVKGWRSDQILASELFGYVIDSDPAIEAVLRQASILAGKGKQRTDEEDKLYENIKKELSNILIPSGQTQIEREIQSEKYAMISKQIKELEQKLFGDNA